MKLFVPSNNKFDTFALFPEEGREYLIDIDKRPQCDDDIKIKCYAKCIERSDDRIVFDCGVVYGDDLTIYVYAMDMCLYNKLLIQEASGSALPYTPVLKDVSYIINPDLCKSHVYELIFNDKQISDTYGVEKINGILIDSGEDFTHHVQNLSFITELGTFNIAMYDDDGPKIWIYRSNEESFAIDNDKIDVRELK